MIVKLNVNDKKRQLQENQDELMIAGDDDSDLDLDDGDFMNNNTYVTT